MQILTLCRMTELEKQITPQEHTEWEKGSIENWVLEAHRLAQNVAYGDLGSQNPAAVGREYERQAESVIEVQLEKAGSGLRIS